MLEARAGRGVPTREPCASAPFELDFATGSFGSRAVLVHLQQQPFKVLALLAGRAGQLVTREEIQREIWRSDTYVDFDQGLNFCIKQIRSALGDQAETPRFVETLPRRGYRFVVPVTPVLAAARPARLIEAPAARRHRGADALASPRRLSGGRRYPRQLREPGRCGRPEAGPVIVASPHVPARERRRGTIRLRGATSSTPRLGRRA